jgi:hypothetical protein
LGVPYFDDVMNEDGIVYLIMGDATGYDLTSIQAIRNPDAQDLSHFGDSLY